MPVNINEAWGDMVLNGIKGLRSQVRAASDSLDKKIKDGSVDPSEVSKIRETIKRGQEEIEKGAEASATKIEAISKSLKDFFKPNRSMGGDILDKIGKVSGAGDALRKLGINTSDAGAGGVAIAGGALASLLLYGAYRTYKTKYTEAGKACSGKSGQEKKDCMKRFKIEAIKKQLQDLRNAIQGCDKSKDPEMCKLKVNAKIIKLRKELMDLTRED